MTNRDAINLLDEVKILDDTMYAYNPSYLEALDMAITALEAEETWYVTHEYPPKTRWIPVSERLPEYGTQVLAIHKDGDYEINHVIDEEDGEWFLNGVIAWMPLPEPYKGEQE